MANSVTWGKVESRLKSIEDVKVKIEDLLDANWQPDSYDVDVQAGKSLVTVDLSAVFASILGSFWKTMYAEGESKMIKDALRQYWQYREKPALNARVVKAEDGAESTIGLSLVRDIKKHVSIDVNRVIEGVNKSFGYNRAVIGTNMTHTEIQFLNSSRRVDAGVGNYLDPGLFIFMNGRVQVSAGVSRLVCTNGATERINLFENDSFEFEPNMIDRAVNLTNWLVEQKGKPVRSIRELAVLLKDYPKPLKQGFWQKWSERVEMKSLMWWDVIDDVTRYANSYLDNTRQKLLQIPEIVQSQELHTICPICASNVTETL